MPLYTYACDQHGEFSAWGKMSESDRPQPCPDCAEPAPRALAHPAVAGSATAGGGVAATPAPSPGGHRCGHGCMH
jgi:putative FmdB family regulatory protein